MLPGKLVAETKMRVPERTVDFVEELGKRLKYAFQKVIRNDTMTKEERMNKSACLPDERYEVGDRLLHYRKPTDEEESMKITERWHHVMVDLAKHPYYEVRDAEGRVLSCNARFLMRDHTAVGESSWRRPREPSAKRGGAKVEDWLLTAGTMVFLESGNPSEPWRLTAVAKSQVACRGGQVRVHYFNRYNNSARIENQTWRSAYFLTLEIDWDGTSVHIHRSRGLRVIWR